MGRITKSFPPEELNRPSKHIIIVCDVNIDTSIIDIEEAQAYVNKYQRRAIILSGKETIKNSDVEIMKYLYIVNSSLPSLKIIDPNEESYKVVYDYILGKFKNGLVIAHHDTITNQIADEIATNKGCGLDFMIYRQDLMSLSGNERMKMNYLRIHFNSEFNFTKDYFRNFSEVYGTQAAIGIFTAQYIANAQYNLCHSYFNENCRKLNNYGADEYIDHYSLNKQLAFYVYYDFLANKIFDMDAEKIQYYMELMLRAIDNKPLSNKAGELSHIYAM